MNKVFRTKVKIQSGGRISLQSPELKEGDEAEVLIILPDTQDKPDGISSSDKDLFKHGSLKGKIWMSEDFDEPLADFKEYAK